MRRPILIALFFAFFISTLDARANIYGLIAMAENPALNAMQGAALMLAGYEEAYYYDIYEQSYMYEGAVLRSSGDAFGADGYPIYNGVVAIVNTQNTLDFDNPDPHVLYGDFYLGAYFYVPVPGGNLWYDPYGYSYFGGDYPGEYTFLPCYCGGYQVYQLIYLGSLGLLMQKPDTGMYITDGTAALTGKSSNIVLTNGEGPRIDNRTTSIQVGEAFGAKIKTDRPITSINWSWEGSVIEDWLVTYREDQDPLSQARTIDARTTTNPTFLLWYSGSFSGTPYKLQANFVIYGRTYIRRSTVKVFKPNVSIESVMLNEPDVSKDYFPNNRWATHLGKLNEFDPGIRFQFINADYPSGFQEGSFEWVQVVDNVNNSYSNDFEIYVKKGVGPNTKYLDTKYPYSPVSSLQTSTYDSPGLELTLQYPNNSIDEDFMMYLMYIPKASSPYHRPQWVPLKAIKWGWAAVGRLETFVDVIITGELEAGNPRLPTTTDATEYPQWDLNITRVNYVKQ